MKIHSYKVLLNEAGTPYLAKDHSYIIDGRYTYDTPDIIADFVTASLGIQSCAEEYLYVLCFDSRNHLIGCFESSHGTVNSSLCSAREIIQKALLIGAVKIALTHNHPGDDPAPSDYDISSTKTLQQACGILGIEVLDHIIVSRSGRYSMLSDNLI